MDSPTARWHMDYRGSVGRCHMTPPLPSREAAPATYALPGLEADALVAAVLRWLHLPCLKPNQQYHVPLWVAVKEVFAVGSTRAYQICRRFDFDPEVAVVLRRKVGASYS
jgi:hypothetical protein